MALAWMALGGGGGQWESLRDGLSEGRDFERPALGHALFTRCEERILPRHAVRLVRRHRCIRVPGPQLLRALVRSG